MRKGILIGSDSTTEWLLPWWWKYYSRYNDFPVAIADFGMTPKMRKWSEKKGRVFSLKCPDFIQKKTGLSQETAQKWQKTYLGDVWQARQAWFKKPLACLQSPFDLTLWMDIDCEVCGSLNPIFEVSEKGMELALVRDERSVEEHNYSSGVMLFPKNAPFLKKWARLCLEGSDKYMGDQNALTDLILAKKVRFKELSPIYNWIMFQGYNDSAVVAHWGAAWGKEHIRKFGGVHDLLGIK
ncbi:MAG TPA: hypothetical protein VMR37_02780 [Rhabdochlamydiaceae bacterium]|nr:hypothetical protein [Rhabdochlamydiaceae bacterium]